MDSIKFRFDPKYFIGLCAISVVLLILAILFSFPGCGKEDSGPGCVPQAVADTGGDIFFSPDPAQSKVAVIGTSALAGMEYSWAPSIGLSDAHVAQPVLSAPDKTMIYTLTAKSVCGVATSSMRAVILKEVVKPKDFSVKVVDSDGVKRTHYTGYVANPMNKYRSQYRLFGVGVDPMPDRFDLRDMYKLNPIEDQGGCGSCWAFSTKSVVEDSIAIRDGVVGKIASGQWMIDCAPAAFSGCSGGDYAFDKYKSPLGMVYESEYPNKYQAQDMSCQTSWLPGKYHEQVLDWGYVGPSAGQPSFDQFCNAMWTNKLPLGVTIGSGGMNLDSSGYTKSCRSAAVDHEVSAYGCDTDHNGKQYVLIRNSWGASWGKGGWAWIPWGCSGLASEGTAYVTYKSACEPQPKADAGPERTIKQIPHTPQVVQLGTPGLSGQSYQWAPVDGLNNPNAAQPIASPAKTTKYSVTAKTRCGESHSDVTVHVYRDVNGADVEVR